MAKFCGVIGFVKNVETASGSGVYKEQITEKKYFGDVLSDHSKWDDNSKVNEDFNISNKFSIVADSFVKENLGYMKYLVYKGFKWKIESADISYPRLTIYIGGLYNG